MSENIWSRKNKNTFEDKKILLAYYLLNRELMAKQSKVSGCKSTLIYLSNLLKFVIVYFRPRAKRLLSKPLKAWRREPIPLRRQRCGTRLLSDSQKLWLKLESQRLSLDPLTRLAPSTNSPWSSTHWAANPPSRPLRTTTHLYSSFTREPASQWSRELARNFTNSMWRRLTLWLLLRDKRRPTLLWPATKTLSILPTKSVSCEECNVSFYISKDSYISMGDYTLKQNQYQWFNQSKTIRWCIWLVSNEILQTNPRSSHFYTAFFIINFFLTQRLNIV